MVPDKQPSIGQEPCQGEAKGGSDGEGETRAGWR